MIAPALDGRAAVARRATAWRIGLLLLPALLAYLLFFIVPIAWIARVSLYRASPGGGMAPAWVLDNYAAFLTDDFHLLEVGRTLMLAAEATVIALVISYPIALFLARTRSRWRGLLITLAIAPLLTSSVVRTYAWLVILGNTGLINNVLKQVGLIESPLMLINNLNGVLVALVQILMPYMLLALLSGFGRFDPELESAAMSLGAPPWRVFWRVTVPLSLPGVATACLLGFVLTISSFITPRLLGGGRVFLMATEIFDQATYTLNWPFAGAISVLLLLLFGMLILGYNRLLRRLEY